MELDSKKLDYGPGSVCAGFPFFFGLLGRRTVIFQLFGFYCNLK